MKINLYEIKHLFISKKNLDDNFIFDSEDIFIDSRIITKNKIFIALKGKNFNANSFIPEVMKQNPKMVVTDNNDLNEGPFLNVECTNKFFMELASFILNKLKAKKIGITGSNGKTTTKELITFFLKNKFPNKVLSTIGNFNNDIGLPLTIMSAKGNEEFVVLEMGTNHPGEIEILADVVKPNISIITNIGDAHIGNYKNQRAIAQEKKNIFKFLKADDFKIIDGKNKFLSELNDSPGKLFLTSEEKSGNEVLNYQNSHGREVNLHYDTESVIIECPIDGEHNKQNLILACAALIKLGFSLRSLKDGWLNFISIDGRFKKTIFNSGAELIDDSYNSNPESMKSAIEYLSKINNKKKILILGDMGELGENSGHYHEKIVSKINNSNLDLVYGMGLEIEKAFKKNKGKNLYIFHDKSELIKIIQPLLSMNVIILIKASRFMNFDTIVRDIKELK